VKLFAKKTALLIIDMVSDFQFEDGRRVARAALSAARNIRLLRQRAVSGGVSNLFVNDNLGHWKSDFRQLIGRCSAPRCLGSPILKLLEPGPEDFYVLKPTHAGFFGTPLDRLLSQCATESLILTGISAHQCILFTANEAYLRDYRLVIPPDCIAAKTSRYRRYALEYFRTVLHADTPLSTEITFARNGRRQRHQR
jgi:nicotinamidase-related amidase